MCGKGGKWLAQTHASAMHRGVFVPSKNTINKIHIVQSLCLSIRKSRCRCGAQADICQICADRSYCPAQCMEFTTQLKFQMGAAVGGIMRLRSLVTLELNAKEMSGPEMGHMWSSRGLKTKSLFNNHDFRERSWKHAGKCVSCII